MKKIIFLLMAVVGCSLVRADSTLNSHTIEAIKTKKMKTLELLRQDEGWTALHDAAYRGDVELMQNTLESLRQKGVKLQEKNPSTRGVRGLCTYTPLHIAAYEGHVEIVRLTLEVLQQAGASSLELNPSCHNHPETPLHIAAYQGNAEIVRLILEALQRAGASPQEMNPLASNEWTPLHIAVVRGDLEIMQLILEALQQAGALPQEMNSLPNYNRWTPLHLAVWLGPLKVVQTLLPFLNAEQIMSTNEFGETALELARNGTCFRGVEIQAAIEARLEELKMENATAL